MKDSITLPPVNPNKITFAPELEHPVDLSADEEKLLSEEEISRFRQTARELNAHFQSPNITLGEERFGAYKKTLEKIGRLTAPIKPANGALDSFTDPNS